MWIKQGFKYSIRPVKVHLEAQDLQTDQNKFCLDSQIYCFMCWMSGYVSVGRES